MGLSRAMHTMHPLSLGLAALLSSLLWGGLSGSYTTMLPLQEEVRGTKEACSTAFTTRTPHIPQHWGHTWQLASCTAQSRELPQLDFLLAMPSPRRMLRSCRQRPTRQCSILKEVMPKRSF